MSFLLSTLGCFFHLYLLRIKRSLIYFLYTSILHILLYLFSPYSLYLSLFWFITNPQASNIYFDYCLILQIVSTKLCYFLTKLLPINKIEKIQASPSYFLHYLHIFLVYLTLHALLGSLLAKCVGPIHL